MLEEMLQKILSNGDNQAQDQRPGSTNIGVGFPGSTGSLSPLIQSLLMFGGELFPQIPGIGVSRGGPARRQGDIDHERLR